MNLRGLGPARLAMAVVPLAVFAVVVAVIAVGVLSPGTLRLSLDDDDPLEFGYTGLYLESDGGITVGSDLPYDVTDLELSVYLVTPSGGESPIFSQSSMSVPAGGETDIAIHVSAYAPAVYGLIMDCAENDTGVVPFRIVATFGYMAGLVELNVDIVVSFSVTSDGSTPRISGIDSGDSAIIAVRDLNPVLMPPDTGIVLEGSSDTVVVDVRSPGDDVVVRIRSDSGLALSLMRLQADNDLGMVTAYDGSGGRLDMTQREIGTLLEVLSYALEELP